MPWIDVRERLITIIELMDSPCGISVRDIQNHFFGIYGTMPDRKSIYRDISAIETHFPIEILRRDGSTFYRFKSFS